jgi:hypothetical protein
MGKNSIWWEAPKNFSDRKNERKIGWLELFYAWCMYRLSGS